MQVAACIIYNLLLQTQNVPKGYLFRWFSCRFPLRRNSVCILFICSEQIGTSQLSFSKSVTSSQALPHDGCYTCFFFLNPQYYQNEIWSNKVCCMTNISNMFLAQCQKVESFRSFYDFLKMAIQRDLAFFKCPVFTFSKNETLES